MGVHGLWQLLQPAGRPVSLESLEGKVLAVDVSIWLHQTMKGMRDKDGNPLPNAHLQGLFSRVCKLLFYRIKPIFVFDGGVPVLKKQTMAMRRERKTEAERESSEIAQKLLRNLVKSQAVKQAIGDSGAGPSRIPGIRRGRNQQDSDIFELAPLPESEEIGLTLNAEEWDRDFELQENWIKEGLAALSNTHPDSEEFRSLSMEIQHEILNELREQKKYHSLSRLTKMPENSDDFSSYQLKKLMKQSRLTNRIEEVRKEMSNKTAVDISYSLGDDYYGDEVEARRIISEDASHYVLIKGMTKKKQEEEAEKYEIQNKVKLEKVEDEDDEEYGGSGPGGNVRHENKSGNISSEAKDGRADVFTSDSDSDIETVMARRLRKKRGEQRRRSSHRTVMRKRSEEEEVTTQKERKTLSCDEDINMSRAAGENSMVQKPPPLAESSSEDEGFIEVTVDPDAPVEEDELFPASIFQTSVEADQDNTAAFSKSDSKISSGKGSNQGSVLDIDISITSDQEHTGAQRGQRKGEKDEQRGEKRGKHRTRDMPQSVLPPDDSSAKRRSVLTDILSQLQEKKKNMSESLAETETERESAQAEEDFNASGGFLREESSDDEEHKPTAELDTDKMTSKTSLPVTVSRTASDEGNGKKTRSSDISRGDNTDHMSDSDEDLKLAIELSLQTAESVTSNTELVSVTSNTELVSVTSNTELVKPASFPYGNKSDSSTCISSVDSDALRLKEIFEVPLLSERSSQKDQPGEQRDQPGEDYLNQSEEDDDFEDVEKPKSPMHSSVVSGRQDSFRLSQELEVLEAYNEDLDKDGSVMDAPGDLSNKGKKSEANSEQRVGGGQVMVTDCKTAQDRPQPEDFEIDQDVETYFHTLNEDDLMDMNSELDSERSALLSERGRQTRLATSVTEQTNMEAQELLRLFGIPFIVSPMEAESQCAYLDITDQTQGTITDDSDIWLFGGRRMYKNFFNQSKHVEFFTFDSIHNHFGLDREQLINIALLCGSDYTEGIQGVGPVRALEIMAEFPGVGLEGLHMFRKWWDKTRKKTVSASENKVRARLKDLKVIPGFPSEAVVDAYLKPIVDESTERFSWGSPDLDLLREFAKHKFGWSRDKSDQSLLPMMKQLNKKESQGRIHTYFQPENFVQTSKIKSERLKKALELVKNPKKTTEQELADEREEDDVVADNEKEVEVAAAGGKVRHPKKRKAEKDKKEKGDDGSRPAKKAKVNKKKMVENEQTKTVGGKTTKKDKSVKFVSDKDVKQNESSALSGDDKDESKSGLGKGIGVKDDVMSNVRSSEKDEDGLFMQAMSEKVKEANARLEKRRGQGKGRGGGAKRGEESVGGRGKILVSLDQRPRSRKGQGSRMKKSGSHKRGAGRGVVNLSESSSSDSSEDEDQGETFRSGQQTNTKSDISAGRGKKGSPIQETGTSRYGSATTVKQKKSMTDPKPVKEKTPTRTEMNAGGDQTTSQPQAKTPGHGSMESSSHLSHETRVQGHTLHSGDIFTNNAAVMKGLVDTKILVPVETSSSNATGSAGSQAGVKISSGPVRKTSADRKTSSGVAAKTGAAQETRCDIVEESNKSDHDLDKSAAEPSRKGRGMAPSVKMHRKSAVMSDDLASSMSATLAQPGDETSTHHEPSTEEEEIDIRKADVSIINKQNLPATLTYLNQRSREDKFLLHQLKGNKVKNVVEQRLEESERRSAYEGLRSKKQERPHSKSSKPTPVVSEENMSFEEMLGGMDDVVAEKVQRKVKKAQPSKRSSDLSISPSKDKLAQAKSLQENIAQQMSHAGTAVTRASSESRSSQQNMSQKRSLVHEKVKQQSTDSHDHADKVSEGSNVTATVSKAGKILSKQRQEENVGFGSSDESMEWCDSLSSVTKMNQSQKKTGSIKSHRSAAFDKPIGDIDDFEDDVLDDGSVCKYSQKKKFTKQLKHLDDSRSVRALGILPGQLERDTQRGRAFVGKGKGRGKNRTGGDRSEKADYQNVGDKGHNHSADIQVLPDVHASRDVTQDEIVEYAHITADDLGSDFSDFET